MKQIRSNKDVSTSNANRRPEGYPNTLAARTVMVATWSGE